MKLRNKISGEIGYFCFANWNDPVLIIMDGNGVQLAKYNSLAELNEEWEDYEEPKKGWYLDSYGKPIEIVFGGDNFKQTLKAIGNYFESEEEAEKAVEKLKAWKRLKDIGCSFDGWNVKTAGSEGDHLLINLHVKDCTECENLLDLLFGGEE